jgi:predicted RNase H-like HicB family nuclease
MLTAYIRAAMQHAVYEWLPSDQVFYGEIPELPGVWATAPTREELPATLQDALEGWIALGLSLRHPFPAIDGHTISVATVA